MWCCGVCLCTRASFGAGFGIARPTSSSRFTTSCVVVVVGVGAFVITTDSGPHHRLCVVFHC